MSSNLNKVNMSLDEIINSQRRNKKDISVVRGGRQGGYNFNKRNEFIKRRNFDNPNQRNNNIPQRGNFRGRGFRGGRRNFNDRNENRDRVDRIDNRNDRIERISRNDRIDNRNGRVERIDRSDRNRRDFRSFKKFNNEERSIYNQNPRREEGLNQVGI